MGDRRITNTYLQVLMQPELVDEKTDFQLAPGLKPLHEGEYQDYRTYLEEASPPESPLLFGMHPNAESSLLNALCENLFFSICPSPVGGVAAAGLARKKKYLHCNSRSLKCCAKTLSC